MPISALAGLSHTTFPSPGSPVPAAPQQSLSSRQRSPFTRQPDAGWQMDTPVGPYGAHRRLQQPPQSLHVVPSTLPLQ
jgi:hypothetical protein